MIPAHTNAAMPLVEIERLLCRVVGHRAVVEDTPVSTYFVCLRCGKFWRDHG